MHGDTAEILYMIRGDSEMRLGSEGWARFILEIETAR